MEPSNKISTEVAQNNIDPVSFFDLNNDFVLAYKKTEKLASAVSSFLLQTKSSVSEELITRFSDQTGRENFIKTATLQIMSTPEYQLC